MSQPSQPKQVGSLILETSIGAVAVQGNYIYIATGGNDVSQHGGLYVIDVSTPANPINVGSVQLSETETSYSPFRMEVAGNFAYILAGSYTHPATGCCTIIIVDISASTNPTVVIRYEHTGMLDMAVDNNYIYTVSQEPISSSKNTYALRVLDISNPANPVEIGANTTLPYVFGVATGSGNKVYVFAAHHGLRVMDVSDPTKPTEIGFYKPSEELNLIDGVIKDNHAFILEPSNNEPFEAPNGIRVIDISNPTQPTEVNHFDVLASVSFLAVVGSQLYVTDSNGYLHIVNVSTPTQPIEAAVYSSKPVSPAGVATEGNYLYVADNSNAAFSGAEWGLQIFDLSDPALPIQIGYYRTPNSPEKVEISNGYAYVLEQDIDLFDGGPDEDLYIIDVQDPAHPVQVSTYVPSVKIEDYVVSGRYLYLAGGQGFNIVDISDPTEPKDVGIFISPGASPQSIAVKGRYAYVGIQFGGFRVVNIANPANPTQVGSFTSSPVQKLAVEKDFVFTAGALNTPVQIRAIDVSQASNPFEIDAYQLPASVVFDIMTMGGYAYVTTQDGGLRVLDITPPNEIAEISVYGGTTGSLATSKGYIYVTGRGVLIFRYTAKVPLDPNQDGVLVYTDPNDLITSVEVSAGTFATPTTLVYAPDPTVSHLPGLIFTNHAFELTTDQSGIQSSGTTLDKPATVVINYSDEELDAITAEDELILYQWHNDAWIDAATTCSPASTYNRDLINNTITVQICQLGQYALFGPALPTFFPFIGDHF